MRLQLRTALAIGCVSIVALSHPAFGFPAGAEPQMHRAGEQPKPVPRQQPHKLKQAVRDSKKPPRDFKLASRDDDNGRLHSMPVTEPLKQPRGGWPALVREARKYLGTNPTDRKKLWCARFMNLVLNKVGYAGTNSDAARSFAQYGHRIYAPKIGAIAVLTRGRAGGHVGVVTGIDPHGNPIIISGNHGARVGEGIYPASRVIAYVMPTESRPLTQVAERSSPAPSSKITPQTQTASAIDIDSPISELIAAIEAEQNRADTQPTAQLAPQPPAPPRPVEAQAQRPAEPPEPRQVVQPPRPVEAQTRRLADVPLPRPAVPQTPHRTVQQIADQAFPAVDTKVADVFGLKDRGEAPLPPRAVPLPQRQPRHPGRVVTADAVYVSPR
jgi:uncharacterized protein (TIGR02594 family)